MRADPHWRFGRGIAIFVWVWARDCAQQIECGVAVTGAKTGFRKYTSQMSSCKAGDPRSERQIEHLAFEQSIARCANVAAHFVTRPLGIAGNNRSEYGLMLVVDVLKVLA